MFYPEPQVGGDVAEEAPAPLLAAQLADDLRRVSTKVVRVVIDLDAAPGSTEDAYLRLYLLSHRLVRPHGINNAFSGYADLCAAADCYRGIGLTAEARSSTT